MEPESLRQYTEYFVILAALSGVVFMIRSFLEKVWNAIKAPFRTHFAVYYCDICFMQVVDWLSRNTDKMYFMRTYRVNSDATDEGVEQKGSVPGYGTCLLLVKGFPPIIFNRTIDNNKKGVYQQADIFNFTFISPKKKYIEKFMKMVEEEDQQEKKRHKLYYRDEGFWARSGEVKDVLPPVDAASKEFLHDLEQNFLLAEDDYKRKAVPYKRGYLLHGIPGSGKTSLVAYAAKKYDIPVYAASGTGNIGDLSDVNKKPAIILIEDIDLSMYANKRSSIEGDDSGKKNKAKVLKGGPATIDSEKEEEDDIDSMFGKSILRNFMNLLDGIQSLDGFIFVFTTNNKDALDEALLRKGRVDVHIEFVELSVEEQLQFVSQFYGQRVDVNGINTDSIPERPLSDLQFICVNNMNSMDGALQDMKEEKTIHDIREGKPENELDISRH